MPRLGVQARSGAHIMRHIGNRHPQDMTARIGRACVRCGVNRIVAVTRINGVNRDQWHVAQICPRAQRCGFCSLRLAHHGIGEMVGDAMLMDRNQADSLCPGRIAKNGRDPRLRQAHAFRAGLFGLYQLAVFGAIDEFPRHAPFLVGSLVDRQNAPAFRTGSVNTQHLQRVSPDFADQTRLIGIVLAGHFGQPCQNAVTGPQRLIALAGEEQDARGGVIAGPFHGLGEQITLTVGGKDGQDRHRRQLVRLAVAAAFAYQRAVGFKFLQQAFQLDLAIALDAKGLGDIAFRHKAGVFGNPLADLVFCGDLGHGLRISREVGHEKPKASDAAKGFEYLGEKEVAKPRLKIKAHVAVFNTRIKENLAVWREAKAFVERQCVQLRTQFDAGNARHRAKLIHRRQHQCRTQPRAARAGQHAYAPHLAGIAHHQQPCRSHRNPVQRCQKMHRQPVKIIHLIGLGHALFFDKHSASQGTTDGDIIRHADDKRHAK